MRLEQIILKNFQAHKETTIQFSPTITTIVGPTDRGKSAIIRAIRWACLNDFAGTDFIREGEKRATVILTIGDQDQSGIITRAKSVDGVTNTYAFDDKEFKAFGQGVPSDIVQALALNEINFQGQHDSPFWFADTAGEVSRKLNSVIDLSVIDTTLANIVAEVRRCMERKDICEERLKEAKDSLEVLAPQKDRITEFQTVKERNEKLNQTTDDQNRLESILETISSNRSRPLAQKAVEGGEVLAAMLEARRAQKKQFSLDGVVRGIERYQATATPPPDFSLVDRTFDEAERLGGKVVLLEDLIDKATRRQAAAQQPPDFRVVEQAWADWMEAGDQVDLLARLVDLVSKRTANINNATQACNAAETKFHEQTKGRVCPLCKNQIR